MGGMWIVATAWVVIAVGFALLIGRAVRMADHKAAETADDAPNFVGGPPGAAHRDPAAGWVADLPTVGTRRDAPTIPGISAARPPVGRPPVPRSTRQRPHRRSGLG